MVDFFSTLATYVHALDPIAIDLGFVQLRWYGLSYVAGFILGYLLAYRVIKTGISSLKPGETSDMVFVIAIGIMLGGRLGYVIFYSPSLIWTFSDTFPWWGVLAVNQGGMASHGGIIGFILACVWYGYRHKHSIPHLWDIGAFAAPIGLGLGRIANFVNGELYGRPVEDPNYVFASKFPQEMYDWVESENVEKLHNLREVLPFDFVTPPAEMVTIAEGRDQWYLVVRGIIQEVQTGNVELMNAIEPVLVARHPSQIYQALLEGLVLFSVLAIIWIRPRKPLMIGGAFCTVYAIVRIIGEEFRVPDQHIADQEFAAWGVTRGQLLSVGLLLVGLGSLAYAWMSKAPKMGSWLPPGEGALQAYTAATGEMTGSQKEAEEKAAHNKTSESS